MEIKRKLLFFIDKEGSKDNGYKPDGKLRLRIRYDKYKVDFNIGYRVDIAKWSTETQRCKAGTSHGKKKVTSTEINAVIQEYENFINGLFKSFEVKKSIPTPVEFREVFNSEFRKTEQDLAELSFFDVFDKFVKDYGIQREWTKATYTKFATMKRHLMDFNPNLSFDSLTEVMLNEFVNFLRYQKDILNSTISKYFDFLKWFLKWAKDKGFNNNLAYKTFKPKLKIADNQIIFLDLDEIKALEAFKIPDNKQYLERVRDVFIFLCFSGLRYSDTKNLRRSNIRGTHIEITTMKTGDSLRIELNNHSKAILEKYEDFHFEDDKVLPVISNQKMNNYLKELMELVGINEMITETTYRGNERIDTTKPKYELIGTHAGRRSFITNALILGIPPHVVMKWTGHKDYKSMKPYIAIADRAKADEMNKFNSF
ncbi:MAG: phage integrase SAM-like domain-containing protein [Bacteroidales bacterium]